MEIRALNIKHTKGFYVNAFIFEWIIEGNVDIPLFNVTFHY